MMSSRKRARSPSVAAPSSPVAPSSPTPRHRRVSSRSSLPGSSPPMPSASDSDLNAIPDLSDDAASSPPEHAAGEDPFASDDGEGEELFGENMLGDYSTNLELDRYSEQDIDDQEYDELDPDARRRAEREMRQRDQRRQGGRRKKGRSWAPEFFGEDPSDDLFADDEEEGLKRMGGRTRKNYDERRDVDLDYGGGEEAIEDELPFEQLSDIKAPSIGIWITIPRVRASITSSFLSFLTSYISSTGASVYGPLLRSMGEDNAASLVVSYTHLSESGRAILALFLSHSPEGMLEILGKAAQKAMLVFFPDYARIQHKIHVRISDLPIIHSLRDLRRTDLGKLVRVRGVITRRGAVFPEAIASVFDCTKCRASLGPFPNSPSMCPNCESRGPFNLNPTKTTYRNFQKMTVQESPGSVAAGRLPRSREVILGWDLVDCAKPGDEVDLTGIYRNVLDMTLGVRNAFPVFSTLLEANYVAPLASSGMAVTLSETDEAELRNLAKDPRIRKRVIRSIAPSIFGHTDIKTALALSLFGGVAKDFNNKHRVRGDINILLLGDPGTAKSQFLKYAEKTASRSVFATGQGASGVGLTASVRKDPATGEWTLEGGALVLADKGVCCIDEFDKMNEKDRTSIHEAMEQQSISISKAGIVTTLQARCAVIAAANPIKGRYDVRQGVGGNVELGEPILSRFDVVCVVRDEVDPVKDEMLARFVVGSHTKSHPAHAGEEDHDDMDVLHEAELEQEGEDEDLIPQPTLQKYFMLAKTIAPKLHNLDSDKVSSLFASLRASSLNMSSGGESGGGATATGPSASLPITVRHLESIIRLAEASARMSLRSVVLPQDVDLAIQVAVRSFVGGQKLSVKRSLERGFRRYLWSGGFGDGQDRQDDEEVWHFVLSNIVREKARTQRLTGAYDEDDDGSLTVRVRVADLVERAKEHEIYDPQNYLRSRIFTSNGYTLIPAGTAAPEAPNNKKKGKSKEVGHSDVIEKKFGQRRP